MELEELANSEPKQMLSCVSFCYSFVGKLAGEFSCDHNFISYLLSADVAVKYSRVWGFLLYFILLYFILLHFNLFYFILFVCGMRIS